MTEPSHRQQTRAVVEPSGTDTTRSKETYAVTSIDDNEIERLFHEWSDAKLELDRRRILRDVAIAERGFEIRKANPKASWTSEVWPQVNIEFHTENLYIAELDDQVQRARFDFLRAIGKPTLMNDDSDSFD